MDGSKSPVARRVPILLLFKLHIYVTLIPNEYLKGIQV